mgnify:CR=1 FL=1
MSQAHKDAISRGVRAYHATCSKKAKAPAKPKKAKAVKTKAKALTPPEKKAKAKERRDRVMGKLKDRGVLKGKAPKTTARMGGKAVKRMPKPMVGGMKPEPAKKRVNPVANPFSSAVRMKRGGGRRKQVAY